MRYTFCICLLFLALSSFYAISSDDFTIGCYTYMKAWNSLESFNNEIITTYLKNAKYNLDVWDTNNPNINAIVNLINLHQNQNIDSYLTDYYWNIDTEGNITSGSHAISTGNYWKFEAEYSSEGGINDSNDKFFYKFSDPNRVGEAFPTGNRKIWKCIYDHNIEPPQEGVPQIPQNLIQMPPGNAICGFKTRWKEYKAGYNNNIVLNNEKNIGPEFRFTSWGEDSLSVTYMANNKLYLRYLIKIDPNFPANAPAFTFKCAFYKKENNNNYNWYFVPLKNALSSTIPTDSITYTYSDMQSNNYTTPEAENPQSGYRSITFEIDLVYLLHNGFMNNLGYWFTSLYGINPYVYWHSGHTISIDYLEIFDKVYDNLKNNPSVVQGWISSRLYNNVKRHYTLDEPSMPQFYSLKLINENILSSINGDKAISNINWNHGLMKKGDGNRFSMPGLYLAETNPSELFIDYYVLEPEFNWNLPAEGNGICNKNSVQWNLDWKVLQHYRKLKMDCEQDNIPLSVVPCTAGRWDENHNCWSFYQYPTPQMVKCLQFLPLCYGVDGIIDYHLYNIIPNVIQQINEPYNYQEIESEIQESSLKWYSMLDVSNYNTPDYSIDSTSLYSAICEANDKICVYGPITKNLNWQDAVTIGISGLFQPGEIYSEPSSLLNGTTYLDSIKVVSVNSNPEQYEGYIQCGFFSDNNNEPLYMLVNRRTNFVNDTNGSLKFYSVSDIRNCVGYNIPPSQRVRFKPNNFAFNHFGSPALYDPYSHSLYFQSGQNIDLQINSGDGILLEMCASLPPSVSSNTTLRKKIYLGGNISLNNGCTVNVEPNSVVSILPNTHITLDSNATFNIRGSISIGDSVHFTLSDNSTLSISNGVCNFGNTGTTIIIDGNGNFIISDSTQCIYPISFTMNISEGTNVIISGIQTYKTGSKIFVSNNSSLTYQNSIINFGNLVRMYINNSSFSISSCTILPSSISAYYDSIFVSNFSYINILNSTISKVPIFVHNSNLYFINSNMEVNSNKTGITINNRDNYIIFDTTIGPRNTITCLSGEMAKGIEIIRSHSPVVIRNTIFSELQYGILKTTSFDSPDSIFNCSFNNCIYGIKETTIGSIGRIQNCSFNNIGDVGIFLIGSTPTICSCDFNACDTGIKFDGSFYSPRLSGIFNSSFSFCNTAIESRGAVARVQNCDFYLNETGLLCHKDSNLNLTYNANNCLRNEINNIKFCYDDIYHSYVQVFSGHNDFYHFGSTSVDFNFDDNYSSSSGYEIDASKNWFEDDSLRVNDPEYEHYVIVNGYDDNPNTGGTDPDGNNRYFLALYQEACENYDQAVFLYETILNDQLEVEKNYYNGCIDGIYRIKLMQENQLETLEQYVNQKIDQYANVDFSFAKLLTDYLIKINVTKKDFQNAIDLIQIRIDNPVSIIDSLRAVLDLEIVLQLAVIEDDKKPVSTKYSQYLYPNIDIFYNKHQDHWALLYKLMNKEELQEIQIPLVPIIKNNYPNPFNPSTTIVFSIPNSSKTKLDVYNVRGQKVKQLINYDLEQGYHKIVWDGRDKNNRSVGSGIYFVRLETSRKVCVRKIMLIK
mgnify:FL=1